MSNEDFRFAFAPDRISLSTPRRGDHALTRANEFEVLGLLCLRMLEGRGIPVTLVDVRQLLDIRLAGKQAPKAIQPIQIRRVVEHVTERFNLQISSTAAKGYGGGWNFANPDHIAVFVNNKRASVTALRQVLGLDQKQVLWEDGLPADIPNVDAIEQIARQAVAIQVIHGHVPADAAGLRSRQADPDSWSEEEMLLLLSSAVKLFAPGSEITPEFSSIRSRVRALIRERREERAAEVSSRVQAKVDHYLPKETELQKVLRDTSSMIPDRSLRLAVRCNEARALRRSGELGSAAKIMATIEEECREPSHGDDDSVIAASISIERAWIAYLGGDGDEHVAYERCESKLLEFGSSIGVGRHDTRLLLEYHLLAALCARRRATLAKCTNDSEAQTWVRRAFQHFNVALRQCLLTEDRELQVHTLGTLGDAIWDLGSKKLISNRMANTNFDNAKVVAIVALRIVGAAMLIARLGGANSGRHYALGYMLAICGESGLNDDDFHRQDFTYQGSAVTLDTLEEVASQALEAPVLAPESRVRISYGLAILENSRGKRDDARARLKTLLHDNKMAMAPRLKQRITATLSTWGGDATEFDLTQASGCG